MRILVTGGAGYVGSHAVRRFRDAGHEPWVFDNLSLGHREAVAGSRLIVGDLARPADLEAVFSATRFDAVVHFAAIASVAESVREPLRYYRQNTLHTLVLLEAMHRHEVRQLVVSSSCTVYGQPASDGVTEETPLQPLNAYARSKLAMEWQIADCAEATGMGAVVLRYFNAAGAHAEGDLGEDHLPETHLIPNALRVALELEPALRICGGDYPTPDGTCIRDYVHVDDLADAHLLALEQIAPGRTQTFNLGSGTPHSVREVLSLCREVTGHPIPVLLTPRRPGDAAALYANSDRARNELRWIPRYSSLRQIVDSAWNWHRRHPLGYASPGTADRSLAPHAGIRRSA